MGILKAWPWAAAALSGVLLVLCFPPWNQGWLCWVALTPLLCALFFRRDAGRWQPLRKALLGYLAGFVFFNGTFYWLSTTLAVLYGNIWLYALTPLLSAFLALYFAFWAWFVGAVLVRGESRPLFPKSLRNLGLACAGACAWIVHEWLRERVFGGFGWNPLGVALYRDLPSIQIAEITGVPGVSFLVAFTNLMIVIIIGRIYGELGPVFLKRIRWEFSFTMAVIVVVCLYGFLKLWRRETGPTVALRVVAVQPNIAQTEKFDRASEEKVLAEIERLTGLATASATDQPGAQLVLWPESVIPTGMFASQRNFRFVIDQLQNADFALLLGTVDFEPPKGNTSGVWDPKDGKDFNTALLLTDHGQEHQSYRKIHLVPFGEYLPLRPVFEPFVGQLVPGDFTPGEEFKVLELNNPAVKIGALVCFEDTLGALTRQFAKAGAQVLVNITNDGWFAQSPAAEQHLANSVLRAIENRRPLIRCGNTGVTCAVSTTGYIDRWLPPFQQGFAARQVEVPTQPRVTFYTRHGDWLSIVAMTITALVGLWPLMLRKRRS